MSKEQPIKNCILTGKEVEMFYTGREKVSKSLLKLLKKRYPYTGEGYKLVPFKDPLKVAKDNPLAYLKTTMDTAKRTLLSDNLVKNTEVYKFLETYNIIDTKNNILIPEISIEELKYISGKHEKEFSDNELQKYIEYTKKRNNEYTNYIKNDVVTERHHTDGSWSKSFDGSRYINQFVHKTYLEPDFQIDIHKLLFISDNIEGIDLSEAVKCVNTEKAKDIHSAKEILTEKKHTNIEVAIPIFDKTRNLINFKKIF